MKKLYEEELVDALYELYKKYWLGTSVCESDDSKYAYIDYKDLIDLEEICARIEKLDS